MATLLGGVVFENETAQRLQSLGWAVQTTPVTGDYGADLVARLGSEALVVQCKDYGLPAGIDAVQQAHFAKTHYGATCAVVIARNGYTRAAKAAASSTGVQLLMLHDLVPGTHLDRRPERRVIEQAERENERRRLEAEAHLRRSLDWRRYDQLCAAREIILKQRIFWRVVCVVSAIPLIIPSLNEIVGTPLTQGRTDFVVFAMAAFAVGFKFLSRNPPLPEKPASNRRGAIVECDICLQKLRVDYGKLGHVRCPSCACLLSAST